ncbi:MAG TPA: hypothetical protein VGR29_00630 [Thermomicrobiales bacterium]|nr:hypothetical protein [Thermomicrobiales bacterium]
MSPTRPQKRHNGVMGLDPDLEVVSVERLERRLEDGYRMIEDRLAAGADVTELEAFWINLLLQYEALCDELPMAA